MEAFLIRLGAEKPPRSFIQSQEATWLDPVGYDRFEIRASDPGGAKTALVLPDIATCPDCLREVFDPSNRRYGYPFTNCTNCGPRFTLIESLPYDRPNTSMKRFMMCPQCQAEYDDPADRRFHAQPNACPICGPHLELWDAEGRPLIDGSHRREVLPVAAAAIREGRIVAVKGLGGFHLMVAAHDEAAVQRLRQRKHREEKPLALMFPALEVVQTICEVSPLEERLLQSPESPIVLLHRRSAALASNADFENVLLASRRQKRVSWLRSHGQPQSERARDVRSAGRMPAARFEGHRHSHEPPLHYIIAPSVAPANPYLGVMLPYTPLHHLLLAELGFPVVATSGNLSDEPICTDEHEAVTRLRGIADLFLVHNRPIVRHVDDSIVRIMLGREMVLRRARGYAPLPVPVPPTNRTAGPPTPPSVLAVGAHLKNTVALSVGPQIFLSQHIGDLETEQAFDAFRRVIDDFQRLYEARPALVVADAHPDYLSTQYARETDLPILSVQHHLAHVFSCLGENGLTPPVFGVSWDGTGYGLDGTIWGGEFFCVTRDAWQRVGHFRTFPLPGGDQAVKEPRRTALGLLFALEGDAAFDRRSAPVSAFSEAELRPLRRMLANHLNAPLTSSVGRLFDAVAALCGLRQRVQFEGQAAMELEFALTGCDTNESYSFEFTAEDSAPWVLDWARLIQAILADIAQETPTGIIAARFHNSLAEIIVHAARRSGESRVVLTGGCFQNRYLTERAVERLAAEGFKPYWHQRVPPNDGGIALGQVLAAWHEKG